VTIDRLARLRNLTDAQLQKRIDDAREEYNEDSFRHNSPAWQVLNELLNAQSERAIDQRYQPYREHFAELERSDLAVSKRDCCVEQMLIPSNAPDYALEEGDVAVVMIDEGGFDYVPFQAIATDYEWSSDRGIHWMWTPLSFGPLQQVSP
jgi:hypothetical protein